MKYQILCDPPPSGGKLADLTAAIVSLEAEGCEIGTEDAAGNLIVPRPKRVIHR